MKKLIILAFISSISFAADPQQNDWAAWDAKQYDENSKQQYQASLKHLENHKELISNAKLVVELGCSTANVAHYLAEHNPEVTVVGVDPEEGAIAYAEHKHADLKNLRLICSPAQTFNLQEHGLPLADLMACYHVSHWIPRDQLPEVFENIAANLAPNGILDLSCSAREVTKLVRWKLVKPTWWLHATRKFIGTAIQEESKPTPLTLQELKQYATNAGLQVDGSDESEFRYNLEMKEAKQKGTFECRSITLKLIAHKLAENKADAE